MSSGLLLAGVAAMSVVQATSVFEFDRWMQQIERRALSVQRNIGKSDAAASVADAREIEALYRLMQGYFETAGDAARAVELSRQGREAAATAIARLEHNDFPAATDAVKTITRECRTCHRAYKPLG